MYNGFAIKESLSILFVSHVIQYDTTGFNNLAMYMTFEISDKSRPLWKEYHKIKAEHLVKFIEENNVKQKIPHPKSQAPMIVSCKLLTIYISLFQAHM